MIKDRNQLTLPQKKYLLVLGYTGPMNLSVDEGIAAINRLKQELISKGIWNNKKQTKICITEESIIQQKEYREKIPTCLKDVNPKHLFFVPPYKYQPALGGTMPGLVSLSGIYFLVNENQVVYVGQSKTLFGRIATHWDGSLDLKLGQQNNWFTGRNKRFEKAFFVFVDPKYLDGVETHFINKYKPEYNSNNGAKGKRMPKRYRHLDLNPKKVFQPLKPPKPLRWFEKTASISGKDLWDDFE